MNKKNSKIFPILTICLLLVSLNLTIFPQTSTSDEILSAVYGFDNKASQVAIGDVYGAQAINQQAFSQAFSVTGATGYLSTIQIGFLRYGTTVDVNWICELRNTTTQTLSTAVATSEVLATSEILNADGITEYPALTICQFYFNESYQLLNGHIYAFFFYADSATTLDTDNKMYFATDNSSPTYESDMKKDIDGSLSTVTTTDLCFAVFASTNPAPTPTPIVTPSPTPTDDYKWDENTNSWSWWNGTHWIPSSGPSPTANAQIVTFTGNMITYIVPLALLLLPAIVGAWALGRAGAAKWGFIAGLNIGAIMCYLYLPTFGLWAVIAIVMVDVVMIFASQRGD